MKQHLSVLMLAARSTIYKVLGLFVVLAITQGALFYFTLQKTLGGEPIGLEQLISQSRIAIVGGVCFVLLCAELSLTGCELGGSKVRYTLKRLSVREEAAVFWWAGYNTVCFFLFWVFQLVIALLLCQLYVTRMDPAYVSGQTIFLAFYRNRFLHSLLPLAETSRYVRNGFFILCLGISAACSSFRQRRGEKGIAMVVLTIIVAVNFSKPVGSFESDLPLVFITLSMAVGAVAGILRERGDRNEF
ncbi:MAG: hypothetical protein ACOX4K_04815 [Bacillota bacterium]